MQNHLEIRENHTLQENTLLEQETIHKKSKEMNEGRKGKVFHQIELDAAFKENSDGYSFWTAERRSRESGN